MKKFQKIFIIGIFVVLFFTGCSEKDDEIKISESSSLKDMIEKSKNVENIYYEVLAEYQKPAYAKSVGKIWINDEKERQELDLSGRKLVVFIDEKKKDYVSYSPDDKSGNKMELTDELITQNSPFGLIEGLDEKEINGFKKIDNKKIKGKDCYVFEGEISDNQKYESNGLKDIKYKVYYEIKSNIIVQMEIYSEEKVITKVEVTKMKLDSVKDDDVKKQIPDNVKLKEVSLDVEIYTTEMC
ncbi:MAG: hypothetical protein ABF289_16680 [Clostridiales bacterium]